MTSGSYVEGVMPGSGPTEPVSLNNMNKVTHVLLGPGSYAEGAITPGRKCNDVG